MHQQTKISMKNNELSSKIIGAAIEVHNTLGPGLLESAYEECLCHELGLRSTSCERQKALPIIYKSKKLDCGYRLDIVVENLIILELKCCKKIEPIHKAQLLTYLKLLKKPKGLLINFNSDNITKSLIPLVTEEFSLLHKD